ncbi:MAG: hypothetical protein NTW05_03710 [Pseudonocardiales bacterium]|jgi:hypothetical protein|nr:hypothetical protein [Pseudonocardiales bacterium]
MFRCRPGLAAAVLVVLAAVVSTTTLRVPVSAADRAGCSTLTIRPTTDRETGQPVATVFADGCVDGAGRDLPPEVAGWRIALAAWTALDRPVARVSVSYAGADALSFGADELPGRPVHGPDRTSSRGFDLRRDGLWHLLPLLGLLVALAWWRLVRAIRARGVVVVVLRG